MKPVPILVLILAVLLVGSAGCGPAADRDDPIQLHVFAAGSLTVALTDAAAQYARERPDIALVFSFDSSGTLKTQIQEGAPCDLFLSAASKQMDQLDAQTGGQDIILTGTRVNLLSNTIVLTVPAGNPACVRSFDDLTASSVSRIGIGNSDVPAGQYAQEILNHIGIMGNISGKLSYGSNVRELVVWTQNAMVDCSMVFSTDARSGELEVVAQASGNWLAEPINYAAAILKQSGQAQEAQKFLAFLQSQPCKIIFEQHGFTVIDHKETGVLSSTGIR